MRSIFWTCNISDIDIFLILDVHCCHFFEIVRIEQRYNSTLKLWSWGITETCALGFIKISVLNLLQSEGKPKRSCFVLWAFGVFIYRMLWFSIPSHSKVILSFILSTGQFVSMFSDFLNQQIHSFPVFLYSYKYCLCDEFNLTC